MPNQYRQAPAAAFALMRRDDERSFGLQRGERPIARQKPTIIAMLPFDRFGDRVPGGLFGKLPTADPRVLLVRRVLGHERDLHFVGVARGGESRGELVTLHTVPIERRGNALKVVQTEIQQIRVPLMLFPSLPFLRIRRIREYQPVEAQNVRNQLSDIEMILDGERRPALLRHDAPPITLPLSCVRDRLRRNLLRQLRLSFRRAAGGVKPKRGPAEQLLRLVMGGRG